jgi:alkanesulfonate monooxygenase SsuD/methylene tetrahydromethanopterin reductase-like flavin-dependent oxidoreductase (luciferase family)
VVKKSGAKVAQSFASGGDMHDLIAGSPDTVAKRVQQLADLGVNHLLLRFLGEWPGETRWVSEQSMKLFSEKVAPRFRGIAPARELRV